MDKHEAPMSRQVVATAEWTASYEDPIVVKAGEAIQLTGKTDTWDGHRWLWAIAGDGRAGWIPDSLAESRDGGTIAKSDYSAVELSCAKGEVLTAIRETRGWTWCRSRDGEVGWVPSRILATYQ